MEPSQFMHWMVGISRTVCGLYCWPTRSVLFGRCFSWLHFVNRWYFVHVHWNRKCFFFQCGSKKNFDQQLWPWNWIVVRCKIYYLLLLLPYFKYWTQNFIAHQNNIAFSLPKLLSLLLYNKIDKSKSNIATIFCSCFEQKFQAANMIG